MPGVGCPGWEHRWGGQGAERGEHLPGSAGAGSKQAQALQGNGALWVCRAFTKPSGINRVKESCVFCSLVVLNSLFSPPQSVLSVTPSHEW